MLLLIIVGCWGVWGPAAGAAAGQPMEAASPVQVSRPDPFAWPPASPPWWNGQPAAEVFQAPVPGLTVGWQWRGTGEGPVLVHYVVVDPAHGLRLRPVVGQRPSFQGEEGPPIRGVEPVTSMAQRTGALAAIN